VDTLGCERGLVLVWNAWLLSFLPVGRKLIYNKLQNVLYDIALKKEKRYKISKSNPQSFTCQSVLLFGH